MHVYGALVSQSQNRQYALLTNVIMGVLYVPFTPPKTNPLPQEGIFGENPPLCRLREPFDYFRLLAEFAAVFIAVVILPHN